MNNTIQNNGVDMIQNQDHRKSEQCTVSARATVMIYDDTNKRWIHSGSSSGLSKVRIYRHAMHNTYRVVGHKLQDHEVVINCAILKGLKYNQATPTFHQWRDNKQVYGLNFSSQDDAEAFAKTMLSSLEELEFMHQQRHLYYNQQEDIGYRSIPRDDTCQIQQQQDNRRSSVVVPPPTSPISPPRTTAPPPVPPPLPTNTTVVAPPPPPPAPPQTAAILRSQSNDGSTDTNSLAAQLQNAKLRRQQQMTTPPTTTTENSGSSTSSSTNSCGNNYGTLGRTGGGNIANMMDEMSKALAKRRAAVEKTKDDDKSAIWEKTNTLPSSNLAKFSVESPKNKRFGSASEETILKVNGGGLPEINGEFEAFRCDIIKEFRKEIAKMKHEIIEVIKLELNRR